MGQGKLHKKSNRRSRDISGPDRSLSNDGSKIGMGSVEEAGGKESRNIRLAECPWG